LVQDTVETQAVALRALTELCPQGPAPRRACVHCSAQQKLNHGSRRARPAVVISSWALPQGRGPQACARKPNGTSGAAATSSYFVPDRYTGKRTRSCPGEVLTRSHEHGGGGEGQPGFLFASESWHSPPTCCPKEEKGATLCLRARPSSGAGSAREACCSRWPRRHPAASGVEYRDSHVAAPRHPAEYVHPARPASCRRAPSLSAPSSISGATSPGPRLLREGPRQLHPNFLRASPPGRIHLQVPVRAALGGSFRVGPATLQSRCTRRSSGVLVGVPGMTTRAADLRREPTRRGGPAAIRSDADGCQTDRAESGAEAGGSRLPSQPADARTARLPQVVVILNVARARVVRSRVLEHGVVGAARWSPLRTPEEAR
jgi:hypothetical protein